MAEETRSEASGRGLHRADVRQVWTKVVDVLIRVVRFAGIVCAALLAIHVVFAIAGANPANGITQFVRNAADTLALGFQTLFTPADPVLGVILNYGAAAVFWLVVTAIATRILAIVR